MNVLVDVTARSGSRCPYTCVLTSFCCMTLIDTLGNGRKIFEVPLEKWGFGSSAGRCIWFHVICCAWLRVMFQIMECVASSISRWLGCKAEYYLLSCSTHSISCLQLSRITNRSLAWRKFLQDPIWCDAFITNVCYWVWFCPWEMFAGEFFWCASLQLPSCF